jgi:hypothetical protein
MSAFSPASEPQLGPAARSLVLTLMSQPRVEDRAATLRELCRRLGDAWFPFYVKLLMVIGEGAPADERAFVADAAAHGFQRGQAAAGSLSAWGMPAPLPATLASAAAGHGFLRSASARPLDPLAYVVVWFGQSTARPLLPRLSFERALVALLCLFNASSAAVAIYQAKLRADAAAASEGAFSTATVGRLQVLVEGWAAGTPPSQLAVDVAAAGSLPPVPLSDGRLWPRAFV